MDELHTGAPRPENPRRRKPRSQAQIIKESYLPLIIVGVAFILIVIFIVGSCTRAAAYRKADRDASIAASIAAENEAKRQAQEAKELLAQAEAMAAGFDYEGAVALLDSFSGEITKFPDLNAKYAEYTLAKSKLVPWEDPNKVVNLSFRTLIADPERAFACKSHKGSYNRNFVTTQEFSKILQQLYDNGYILVSPKDFLSVTTDGDGNLSFSPKALYLPEGRKPLMLTQCEVNYNLYMVDSNNDGRPDKGGDGFASKLVLTDDGSFACEMVDKDGNTVVGDYDMIPILENFLTDHPDFSYKGAKAVIALSGLDGLFGYRTDSDGKSALGQEGYQNEVAQAGEVVEALKSAGYDLACYTYDNVAYGKLSTKEIQADLQKWTAEVTPILGPVDILVYAQNSDITDATSYSGEKFDLLMSSGFRYFMGFSTGGGPWADIRDTYVRQGRILVGGSNLKKNPDWFTGMFDAAAILDSSRPKL